ncbi:MAG: hypothetical protein ABSG46_20210 [Candidatus Binataceae bacterium]|jgi:hypothetical protein
MPWSLRAEGHATSEAAEKKMFRLLSKVLRSEGAGTAQPVYFEGDHVTGNPLSDEDLALAHPDTVTEDDEEEEDEAEAGLVHKGESYPTTVSVTPGEAVGTTKAQEAEEAEKAKDPSPSFLDRAKAALPQAEIPSAAERQ